MQGVGDYGQEHALNDERVGTILGHEPKRPFKNPLQRIAIAWHAGIPHIVYAAENPCPL